MISGPSRQRSILLFYISTALFWGSMYLYVPILSVHAENMGASMGLVGAVVGAYGFSQFVLRVPLGIWSDRIGLRKPFIVAGIAAAAVGAAGLGLSSDPMWLVVWRATSGIGAAAWVAFTVLFSSYFAPGKATQAMGYAAFVSGLSQMVATYSGGLIAQQWGWTAPFWVAAAVGILGVAAAMAMDEKPLEVRRKTTVRELTAVMTTPLLLVASIAAMMSSWTQWATANGFSLVYAANLGASRAELGTLTMVMQLAYTAVTLLSSPLADRIGTRTTATIGLAMQAVGGLMVPVVHSVALVGVSQALCGSGRGLAYPLLMGLSIKGLRPADRATAMGLFQAVYAFGMFAGPTSAGVLGDSFGITGVFVVAGLAAASGALLVRARVPSRG